MSDYAFEYILVGVFGLLSIFSFVIGMEQMIKITVSNYIINIICLTVSNSITVLIDFLSTNPGGSFLALGYDRRASFFEAGQVTLVLILYGALLLLVFNYSKINITLPDDNVAASFIQLLLIPLTVFSMIFSLQIAIFGDMLFNLQHMVDVADQLTSNPNIHRAIVLAPVRIAIHALVTLWMTMQLGVKYNPPAPMPVFE